MLTEDRKDKVRILSDEELELQVNRGRTSIFQGELYGFAKTELVLRKDAKREAHESASLAVAKYGSKWMRWGVIVALLGIAVAVALARCGGGN
jgi:hypothetical protein